jgi:cytochrome c-type biogenesis protein CcmE
VRIVVATLVIAGALAWVAVGALRSNLEYYKTPTEVLHLGGAAFGERIRLGGVVEPGSVCARGPDLRFVLTDLTTSMTVVTSSGVPQLFGGGRGVVAEGAYARDGVFHADDILVKHDDAYAPPKNGPVPVAATPACG